jgi:hypothetical protein
MQARLKALWSSALLSLGLTACNGVIGEATTNAAGDRATGGAAAGRQGGQGSAAQNTGACTGGTSVPGPMYLRRLTNQEYANTVRDLLGVAPSVAELPPDLSLHGFDNNAETIQISVAHLEVYRKLAEGLASALVASPTQRTTIVGCDLGGATAGACLESFVRQFGLRAFRRPLTDEEFGAVLALAKSAPATDGPWGPAGLVVEALLQSPSFLFRVEVGRADPARPGLVHLTGHEVATRLSYLLWGTMPDAKLLDAAAGGRLDSPEGIQTQALAMLQDSSRAHPGFWSFASQWLRVTHFEALDRPATQFPLWTEALAASMVEETRRVVEDQTSRVGAPLLDLIDTRSTFVDSTLASFYGVASPGGNTWASVAMPAAQGRQGILTQGSILAVGANTRGTTPITRGKYIRETILCDVLPNPPPNVPPLAAAKVGLSERERLAEHRVNAACGACHSLLEPLGFGLSNFDAIGTYRTTDDSGLPIDASGSLEGLPDPSFNGAVELVQRLRGEPRVGKCVATHLLRYALGRGETDNDTCTIAQLGDVLQGGGDLPSLVRGLVGSDPFLYRQAADSTAGGNL